MEYIYIAMVLQELGKEINEINIQKIFEALDVEVDNNKIQLYDSSISICLQVKDIEKKRKGN